MTSHDNGDAPALDDDVAFLAAARARLTAATTRREKVAAELAEATSNVKRWEKVVRDLDPDPEPMRPAPVGKGKHRTAVGAARLEQIETAIREITGGDADHDFRPTDVRNHLGEQGNSISSGATSQAFLQLRERQVIRFVRKDGLAHIYRLTRIASK